MRTESQVKAILIDFYGVICPNTTHTWLNNNISNVNEDMHFYHQLLERNNRGLISKKDFYKAIAIRTKLPEKTVKTGIESYTSINEELIDMLEKIKQSYKIILVTNSSGSSLKLILKKYKLNKVFDKIFVSAEMGTIKPELEFFNVVLSSLKLEPSQVLFIDDSMKNVSAAKFIGVSSIHYENNQNLIYKLKNFGIPV